MEKPCAACGKTFRKPPNVSRAAWPKRLYCSKACQYNTMRGRPNLRLGDAHRGKKLDPEHVARISEGLKRAHTEGRMHVIDNSGLRGEQTSQWKGDDVQYRGAHWRLRTERGNPSVCEFCGGEAHEWALSDDAEVVKVQETGRKTGLRYSPRPSDYIALCRPCHRLYDRERDPLTGRYL